MNKNDFNKLAADHFISRLIGGIVIGSIAFIAGIITAIVSTKSVTETTE